MIDNGIPSLRSDRLSTVVPTCTYAGGSLVDPEQTLFLWRSCSTEKARDGSLCFYLDDSRLEPLWRSPGRYALEFKRDGIKAVVEPDFSLWRDQSLEMQLYNVKRKKITCRIFQSAGLRIVPNLNWSTAESFDFCFAGIPVGCPVVMTECRTPGGNDDDRRAFLAGLTEGVRQTQPQHVVIYGGTSHRYWLQGRLPFGPEYHLIDSWTDARGKIRAAQEREARDRNQPNLFAGGKEKWAVEEVQAA